MIPTTVGVTPPDYLVAVNRHYLASDLRLAPERYAQQAQVMTKLSTKAIEGLRQISSDLGYNWGMREGNITKLLECIGQGLLIVSINPLLLGDDNTSTT